MEGKSEQYPSLTLETLKEDPQTKELLISLDEKMLYHNYKKEPSRHTSRVVRATSILSQMEGLNETERNNLRIAGLYHDISYPGGAKGHEERSAVICGEVLDRFQVDTGQILAIQDLIRTTKGEFVNGTFITYPQTISQKIMCDSDMSLVGETTELFLEIGDLLKQELGVDSKQDWLKSQVDFLSGLKWHTQSAYELWEERRIEHIASISQLL